MKRRETNSSILEPERATKSTLMTFSYTFKQSQLQFRAMSRLIWIRESPVHSEPLFPWCTGGCYTTAEGLEGGGAVDSSSYPCIPLTLVTYYPSVPLYITSSPRFMHDADCNVIEVQFPKNALRNIENNFPTWYYKAFLRLFNVDYK